MSPEKVHTEPPEGDPIKVINRIEKSVKSGKINPHQLVSDAAFLLRVSDADGKQTVRSFLQTAVQRAPAGVMQTALIDHLIRLRKQDLKTHDQADTIRQYLQMEQDLEIAGTKEGQMLLDAMQKEYPETSQLTPSVDDLVTRWGKYNTTLKKNPAEIDLAERQKLCEETARLLNTTGLTEEQLLDLKIFSDKAVASIALATDRLGLKPLEDDERSRFELLEAGDLVPIYQAKQEAGLTDELPDFSEMEQAYHKQLETEVQKAGQNNPQAVADLVRDWISAEQPPEEPAIPLSAAQAAQEWNDKYHGGHLEQRVDLTGEPQLSRRGEKRQPQQRAVPSYNRQIEALRNAPRYPESDSLFEDLAIARFENTIDSDEITAQQRALLLASREHYIYSVSEQIRDDLAQAILREALRPDEVDLPDQEKESVMQAVYRLVDRRIPEEEEDNINKLFVELSNMGGLDNIGRDNDEVMQKLNDLLNLQGDESYAVSNALAERRKAALLVNADINEDTAVSLLHQKWEAIQKHYDQSANYFDNLLKDRTTPLNVLVYALIIANRSASTYDRELLKYEQALAAQDDIKITEENGEVNLELEESFDRALNAARQFDKELAES